MKVDRFAAAMLLALVLGCPAASSGQQASAAEQLAIDLGGLIQDLQRLSGTGPQLVEERRARFDFRQNLRLVALALAARFDADKRAALIQRFEETRVDKQLGADAGHSGSTSLVSKGSVPSILGLAVDNGALVRTVTGTTITFRGNPVGIAKALAGRGFIEGFDEDRDDPATRALRRLSFGFAFDASRGPDPTIFSGDAQELASFSVRYELINNRDPRLPEYEQRWAAFTATKAQAVADRLGVLTQALLSNPALVAWHEEAAAAIATTPGPDLDRVVRNQFARLQRLDLPPDVDAAIRAFSTSFDAYMDDRAAILRDVNRGALVTIEYIRQPELAAPGVSSFTVIAETALFQGAADLTFNGSISLLDPNAAQTRGRRVRDYRLAGQLDLPLGPIETLGPFVVSLALQVERLKSDTETMLGLVAPKGDIWVGQLKLTIPMKGSGVRVPLSVSVANRTELLKEREVRGNFGLSFDLDVLYAAASRRFR